MSSLHAAAPNASAKKAECPGDRKRGDPGLDGEVTALQTGSDYGGHLGMPPVASE